MTDIKVKNEPIEPIPNVRSGNMVSAEEMSKLIASAVAEALKVAIPAAAIGINAANKEAQSKTQEALIREAMRRTVRCPICALPQTACGGPWKKDKDGKDIIESNPDGSAKYDYKLNHVNEYVGPVDPNLFKWFQGMIVNGVRFLSDRPGHKIWIPRKSDILTSVNYWEHDQKELLQKRQAEGNGAGSVGPGGAMPRQTAALGWR